MFTKTKIFLMKIPTSFLPFFFPFSSKLCLCLLKFCNNKLINKQLYIDTIFKENHKKIIFIENSHLLPFFLLLVLPYFFLPGADQVTQIRVSVATHLDLVARQLVVRQEPVQLAGISNAKEGAILQELFEVFTGTF